MIGKERGYVTAGELDAVFEALDVEPPDDLEPAYELLRSMDIGIRHS